MLTYKDKSLPHNLRLDAAKVAIRFEKPALTAIDANNTIEKVHDAISDQPMTNEEWVAKFTTLNRGGRRRHRMPLDTKWRLGQVNAAGVQRRMSAFGQQRRDLNAGLRLTENLRNFSAFTARRGRSQPRCQYSR
jgi:hypothetical protein